MRREADSTLIMKTSRLMDLIRRNELSLDGECGAGLTLSLLSMAWMMIRVRVDFPAEGR